MSDSVDAGMEHEVQTTEAKASRHERIVWAGRRRARRVAGAWSRATERVAAAVRSIGGGQAPRRAPGRAASPVLVPVPVRVPTQQRRSAP